MQPFAIVTPAIYWLLVMLWGGILIFYVRRIWQGRARRREQGLVLLLMVVLAIDAFRTVVESAYFGVVFTSMYGWIPGTLHEFMQRPHMTLLPKLLNLAAAIAIIALLLKRWLPESERRDEERRSLEQTMQERIDQQTRQLTEANAQLRLDLETQRQTDARLRESEERYRLLAETAQDLIMVMELNGAISYANPAMLEATGYDREEIASMKSIELIDPEYRQAVEERIELRRRGDRSKFRYEAAILRKDGGQLLVDVSSTPLVMDETIASVLFVGRDITQRKRMELQMQNAQKLESLGVLAGGIAHDFNNLLTSILGNGGLIRMEAEPNSPVDQHAADIERAAEHAADLCRQMLAYSGRGKLSIEAIDLSAVVRDMTQLIQASLSRKARLELELAPGLPPVAGDVVQLRQVIMNVIINASDALEDRMGTIRVSTGTIRLGSEEPMRSHLGGDLPPGEYVFCRVEDDGCGMTRETLERIFDPFYTTKFTGRGLGLAAALGIVRGHDGAIVVESELGRGATMTMLLPPARAPIATAGDGAKAPPAHACKGTILIVEDEESVRVLTSAILRRAGFEVLTANDGREGVETFREHAGRIDAVLLDMTMPFLNGDDVFERIDAIAPGIPVVLSSGFNQADTVERWRGERRPSAFLHKPYRPDQLVTKICQVLERSPRAKG